MPGTQVFDAWISDKSSPNYASRDVSLGLTLCVELLDPVSQYIFICR